MQIENRSFVTVSDVEECLSNLNSKKCEGFDRIPVCLLYDARKLLMFLGTATVFVKGH